MLDPTRWRCLPCISVFSTRTSRSRSRSSWWSSWRKLADASSRHPSTRPERLRRRLALRRPPPDWICRTADRVNQEANRHQECCPGTDVGQQRQPTWRYGRRVEACYSTAVGAGVGRVDDLIGFVKGGRLASRIGHNCREIRNWGPAKDADHAVTRRLWGGNEVAICARVVADQVPAGKLGEHFGLAARHIPAHDKGLAGDQRLVRFRIDR